MYKIYTSLYRWCIQNEYFLHHPSLPCLKPNLIAAINPVFSQSKDFSIQQRWHMSGEEIKDVGFTYTYIL